MVICMFHTIIREILIISLCILHLELLLFKLYHSNQGGGGYGNGGRKPFWNIPTSCWNSSSWMGTQRVFNVDCCRYSRLFSHVTMEAVRLPQHRNRKSAIYVHSLVQFYHTIFLAFICYYTSSVVDTLFSYFGLFSAHYSMHLFLSFATLERQSVPIVHKGGTSYNYTRGYAVPTWRWLPQDCGTSNCREKRGKVGTFHAFVSLQISHIVCHGSWNRSVRLFKNGYSFFILLPLFNQTYCKSRKTWNPYIA